MLQSFPVDKFFIVALELLCAWFWTDRDMYYLFIEICIPQINEPIDPRFAMGIAHEVMSSMYEKFKKILRHVYHLPLNCVIKRYSG